MKLLSFLSIVFLILTVSCDQVPAQVINYDDHKVSQAIRVQYPTNIDSSKNLEWPYDNPDAAKARNADKDIPVMHAVLNSQTGRPYWYVPLPENWKIISRGKSGAISIEGPNGLIITPLTGQNFVYSTKQEINRAYQESNMQVKKPMTMDSIFSELLIPEGIEMGMTLLAHYPLPEVAANNAAYLRQFSGSAPQDVQKAEGSDWMDREGNKVFIVIYYTELKWEDSVNWGYYKEMLKASSSFYEQAKKQFIHSISNKRFDKNEIEVYNDSIAQQKYADERMRSYTMDLYKDSTGQLVSRYDRMGYGAYVDKITLKRFGSNRTSEEIATDSVNVNLAVNPFDGNEYLVASGFETYWINEKCQYIQSEDSLFNPNTFEARPGLWQKADLKVYKKSIATNPDSDYEY